MPGGLANPWVAVNVTAGLLVLAFGLFVFFASPGRSVQRATLLLSVAIAGTDLSHALARGAATQAEAMLWFVARTPFALAWLQLILYITLVFPRARLRGRSERAFVAGSAASWLVLLALFLRDPASFVALPTPSDYGWSLEVGPMLTAYHVAGIVLLPLAMALALDSARRPSGPREREQSRLLAAGIGLHSSWIAVTMAAYTFWVTIPYVDWSAPVALALFGYAILKYQLFDIDLKVKRGTATTFLLAFGVAAYVGLAWLLDRLLAPAGAGGVVPQALAAGLVLLAATRVRAFSQALADALLPQVRPGDAAYEERRRLEVYQAALDGALQGGMGDADAAALRALRQRLGVSEREHELLLSRSRGGAPPLAPGELLLGRYRIARELGRGAFGEVFLARDERLGRDLVVKRLTGERRRDAGALRRFQQEMRLASAIHHPNIVVVYDAEVVGDDAYLLMEYLPGGSLADRLGARGPLGEEEACRLGLDVLAALAALHARGILHRDLKPGNILFDGAGRAKLGDFTVAREAISGETVGVTGTSAPVGTLAYMSPEQARGLPATARSDLYGLGATLYEALAGAPAVPVRGLGEFEARLRIMQQEPALPLPGVGAGLNAVLARALAKDPDARFASAEEMGLALAPPAAPPGLGIPARRD